MTARHIKALPVRKGDWVVYWQRASELLRSMQYNMERERWNAAVIDAVHCAISSNDSYTVAKLGMRSAAESHNDAIVLLREAADNADIENQLTRLGRLLGIKSHVEYGPSVVRPDEAERVAKDTERFYRWVETELKAVST